MVRIAKTSVNQLWKLTFNQLLTEYTVNRLIATINNCEQVSGHFILNLFKFSYFM